MDGESADYKKAVAASVAAEPIEVENRLRAEDHQVPTGIKNVGNTCYFNSLIQALFWMPNINQKVLQARIGGAEPPQNGKQYTVKEMRKQCAKQMCLNMQRLFAQMLTSNQKYVDPSMLVHSVVDDENHKVRVGDEMDVTEYLLNLIERMEEGFDEDAEK